MMDLTHWDFADSFSAKEAAALILGVEPDSVGSSLGKCTPIYRRMETQYLDSINSHAWMILGGGEEEPDRYPFNATQLSSIRALQLNDYEDSIYFLEWLEDPEAIAFTLQQFSRHELVRWLTEIRLKSAYKFDINDAWLEATSTAQDAPQYEKPLMTSERNQLLKMILGMAMDSYGYDPVAKKNVATGQIVTDLANFGISIDAGTVLKYLKDAANTVTHTMPKSQ
jgi:hypothetical protein